MDIDKIIEANGSIYRTYFPEIDIALSYRLLTLREYKVFRSLRDGNVIGEIGVLDLVFDRCYLGNSKFLDDDLPAGICLTVGGLIMYLSGDCDQETLVQDLYDVRNLHPTDTVFEYMRSAIITAFPTYTLDDLDKMTRTKYLKTFAIAENIISKQNPEYEKLDISKITSAADRNKTKSTEIDFAKENRAIQKSVGHWASEEAEKQYREEKLSKRDLRQLDNRGR